MSGTRALRLALVASVCMLGALSACSSDDDDTSSEASTCEAMQELSSAVNGLSSFDLSAEGTNGRQAQLDTIESDWQDVRDAASDQFGDELDSLEQSVDTLGDTLGSIGDGGQGIGSLIDQVRTEITAVGTAWQALADSAESELSGCDLSSS
jgi:hypothetical protein